jgi:hypothetical protein
LCCVSTLMLRAEEERLLKLNSVGELNMVVIGE